MDSQTLAGYACAVDATARSKGHDTLVAIATVAPVFAVVAFVSTLEKALLASVAFGAIWVAMSERWQQRDRRGFWLVVVGFALVNAVAIWALPDLARFKAALAVACPLGMAEGFLLYWLLGRLS